MSAERPLVQDAYMSLEMVAALEHADGDALKAEIAHQQGLNTPTSAWLEIVGVQYEVRDAYRRQKGLWLHLGSCATWSRYADVSTSGRAVILQRELEESHNRLGPLHNEVSSDVARQQVRMARIAALQEYDGNTLVRSFKRKGKRSVECIPEIDNMIAVSRVIGAQQRAQMLEVKRAPRPSQHDALKEAAEDAIIQLDAQLLGALANH